ncbi:MAG: hypothetical protein PUB18_01460 [bacterium]|nr:hypothetical protein [bacterium]
MQSYVEVNKGIVTYTIFEDNENNLEIKVSKASKKDYLELFIRKI